MAPIRSKAALRVLISILLASSIADAAALPHQVLDPRTPLVQQKAAINAVLQAAVDAGVKDPKNFFDQLSQTLKEYSGYQILKDFWSRLFGDDRDDDDEPAPAVTVFVTPTPPPATSSAEAAPTPVEATSTSDTVLPPGPPSSTSEVPVSSDVAADTGTPEPAPEPTPTPEVSSEIVVIVAPEPTPTPEVSSEIVVVVVPEVTPTSLVDEFSILPVEPIETAINATVLVPVFSTAEVVVPLPTPEPVTLLPAFPANVTGTSYPLPTAVSITDLFSTTIPVELLTSSAEELPVGTGLPIGWNDTTAAGVESTTVSSTTLTVVTETLLPVPVVETTVAPSAGTGLPIILAPTDPLWPNATVVIPPIPSGTGIILPISEVEVASPSAGTGLPLPIAVSESPLYPNVTTAPPEAPTLVLSVPITVTGIPYTVVEVNVTISAPTYPNTTYVAPTAAPSADSALPVAVSETPLFPNTTAVDLPTLILGTGAIAPSAGTITAVISFTDAPVYPNSTTTISDISTDTATATLILPAIPTDAEEDATVEFPG